MKDTQSVQIGAPMGRRHARHDAVAMVDLAMADGI